MKAVVLSPEISVYIYQNTRPRIPVEINLESVVTRKSNLKTQTLLENCALLGYYAESSGNSLPTFRDNLLGPSSRVQEYGTAGLSLNVGP